MKWQNMFHSVGIQAQSINRNVYVYKSTFTYVILRETHYVNFFFFSKIYIFTSCTQILHGLVSPQCIFQTKTGQIKYHLQILKHMLFLQGS